MSCDAHLPRPPLAPPLTSFSLLAQKVSRAEKPKASVSLRRTSLRRMERSCSRARSTTVWLRGTALRGGETPRSRLAGPSREEGGG